MPFKKRSYRKRKPVKKGRRKRRRKPHKSGLNYALMETPFPKTLSTKLLYRENEIRNPASLVYTFDWNANSLFDPNRTGTGHQPMFFDQLCNGTQYKRYKVRGIKYKFIISGLNTPARYACALLQNTTAVANLDDLAEIKGAKSGVVNTLANGAGSIRTISGYANIRKTVGSAIYQDANNQALYNANPATVVLLKLKFASLDGATNMTNVNIISNFTYYCDIFDLVPRTGS